MTEEEASKKWCPFGTVATQMSVPDNGLGKPVIVVVNRHWDAAANKPSSCCIGSICMAWKLKRPTDKASGYCGMMK